ncbi:MAG: NADH-quinone oxidoreductase subunit M, partial [Gluconacetobacter diazotrophicus]|nr:NADH-quinone oxidoreductase subunit M [Gluconacetobacter diazotrophicus]
MHLPLVTILTFLPALGALLLLLVPKESGGEAERAGQTARTVALGVSGLTLLLAIGLWLGFQPGRPGAPHAFQFEDRAAWMSGFGVSYHVGLDGISLLLVVLTALVTPVAILASYGAKGTIGLRPRDYMIAVLLLESTIIGLYSALDFVLFYVFYEATLIPASLLIGIWGGQKRTGAAIKFFLFTFGSSLFMLLSILAMWRLAGTTDVPTLLRTRFAPEIQFWMFLGLAFAFGVKLPLFPLHGWLPDTYTEAPSSTTAIMSAVLGKAGGYGLLRFAIAMLPDAAHRLAPLLLWLGI